MKKLITLLLLIILNPFLYSQSDSTITIMTYNIHHGEGIDEKVDLKRIADLILEYEVDIAALQEVDIGVERTDSINIMEMLSSYTGMNSVFGKNIDFQGGDYGNGILSRFPVIEDTNYHYNMIRKGEQRGLLQILIKINSDTLAFMNTHIDYREDDSERLQNVKQIKSISKQFDRYPIIICGDFNDIPGSRTHSRMKDLFIDSWELLNQTSGFTYPAEKPEKRIDYIFYRNSLNSKTKLRPIIIEVITSEASDHLPVIAEFKLIN